MDLFEIEDQEVDVTERLNTGDRVQIEVAAWEAISKERIAPYVDKSGIINEFAFVSSLYGELPLHHFVFQQMSSHRPHEANCEETFSLSNKLSDDNGKTLPGFLAALVRITKNRTACDPNPTDILKDYVKEYKKLPELGDDVTDAESGNEVSGTASDCMQPCRSSPHTKHTVLHTQHPSRYLHFPHTEQSLCSLAVRGRGLREG